MDENPCRMLLFWQALQGLQEQGLADSSLALQEVLGGGGFGIVFKGARWA